MTSEESSGSTLRAVAVEWVETFERPWFNLGYGLMVGAMAGSIYGDSAVLASGVLAIALLFYGAVRA